MGAISSSSVHRNYPVGPPSCTQCPPNQQPNDNFGFIGIPSNQTCLAYFGPNGCTPVVSGWDSPFFLFLYSLWGFTALSAVVWGCYRSSQNNRIEQLEQKKDSKQRDSSNHDEESQSLLEPAEKLEDGELDSFSLKEKDMTAEYYIRSKVRWVAMFLLGLNGTVLLVYYLILTFDFYLYCENVVGSVDNACFFGSFQFTGNYENNAEAFFLVWIVMVVYCVFVAFFLGNLHGLGIVDHICR